MLSDLIGIIRRDELHDDGKNLAPDNAADSLDATGDDDALTALEGGDPNVAAVVARFGGRDGTVARFKVLARRRRRRNRGRQISVEHACLRVKAALINAGRRRQQGRVRIEIEGMVQRCEASIAGIGQGSPACVEAERRLAEDARKMLDRLLASANSAGVDCESARKMGSVLERLMAERKYRAVSKHAFQTSGALATMIACKGPAPLPRPVPPTPQRAVCLVAKSPARPIPGREGRSRSHRRVVSRTGRESSASDGGPGSDGEPALDIRHTQARRRWRL